MNDALVLFEQDGPVAVLTLNRPDKLNAINAAMLDALEAALDRAERDDTALLQALELDVIIESTETPESRAFNEVLARDGAKAAIAWREARLGLEESQT